MLREKVAKRVVDGIVNYKKDFCDDLDGGSIVLSSKKSKR